MPMSDPAWKHLLGISGGLGGGDNQEKVSELFPKTATGRHSGWLHLYVVSSTLRLPSLRIIQKTLNENQFSIINREWTYLEKPEKATRGGQSNVCRHRRLSWWKALGRRKEADTLLGHFCGPKRQQWPEHRHSALGLASWNTRGELYRVVELFVVFPYVLINRE